MDEPPVSGKPSSRDLSSIRERKVALEIGRVVAVFPDDDDTIHRQFPAAKGDGLACGLVDRDVLRPTIFWPRRLVSN